MSNIKNIEELHELINPEFLTTEESCYEMLKNVDSNHQLLNKYGKAVVKRLAKIKNEKIFTQESTYGVTYVDYYVANNKNEIKSCADSLFDEIIDFHDGYDFQDFEELKE